MKLFVDDIRQAGWVYNNDGEFVTARTFDEAVAILQEQQVSFISFDHDLGLDEFGDVAKDGYDLVKWIVQEDIEGNIDLPSDFDFKIHSSNPCGRENIQSLLSNYLKHKREQI